MKKTIGVLIVMFLVVSGTYATAAEKIGFIDMRQILILSDAGKEAALELQEFVKEKKTVIDEQEKELKKLQEELQKLKPVLTERAYKEKEVEGQRKYREYKRFIEDFKEEARMKEQQHEKRLIPEVLKLIQEIGEKEDYTMIVETGVYNPGVAYFKKSQNITKKVIQEFNKLYKSKKQ
ncbi:MAG: OmpH family outer membrane protein [Deltaproteobacteria bacterium]|nr:OmpH family outer membrane protein [Deltaproteobacteria bacterium]